MIRFYHVDKAYRGETLALSDVNLIVHPRQFCFITGSSGAGKSTLLKLIIREEIPTTGQILVNGRNLSALTSRQMPYFRRRIGVVFQDFRLIPTRTVYENVSLVLTIQGVPSKERKRRAFSRPSGGWASRTACPPFPSSSPAASSSGWPSPGPSSTAP